MPVGEPGEQNLLEQQQGGGADNPTPESTDAADDDHHQQRARLRPLQQVRAGEAGQVGEQRAGQPGDGAAEREANQAVAENRIAERFHARLVLADGLNRPSEAGLHQPGK